MKKISKTDGADRTKGTEEIDVIECRTQVRLIEQTGQREEKR